MKFDDILEEINGLGPFQITLLVLFCIPRIVLPCHFLLNNFIAVLPPHHCDFSSLDSGGRFRNLTQEQRLIVSLPVRENGGPEACEMFAVPQLQLLANISNSTGLLTVPCQSGWIYDNSSFTSSLAMEVQGFIFLFWSYIYRKTSAGYRKCANVLMSQWWIFVSLPTSKIFIMFFSIGV